MAARVESRERERGKWRILVRAARVSHEVKYEVYILLIKN